MESIIKVGTLMWLYLCTITGETNFHRSLSVHRKLDSFGSCHVDCNFTSAHQSGVLVESFGFCQRVNTSRVDFLHCNVVKQSTKQSRVHTVQHKLDVCFSQHTLNLSQFSDQLV